MGCFNAPRAILICWSSQKKGLEDETRTCSIALEASLKPCPFEVTTFLTRRPPTVALSDAFRIFHFSEYWRASLKAGTALSPWANKVKRAAHIMVAALGVW